MRDIRRFYVNGKNPYKSPTKLIDSHHPDVKAAAEYLIRHTPNVSDKINKILTFIQQEIPFRFTSKSLEYSASKILYKKKGDLIQKLMLTCAMLRATDIGCRIHFHEVNHPILSALKIENQQLVLSGYIEVYDDKQWIKADRFLLPDNTSAFLLKKPIAVQPYSGKSELIWVAENTEDVRHFGILNDAAELKRLLPADHLKKYQFSWMQLRKMNKSYIELQQKLSSDK